MKKVGIILLLLLAISSTGIDIQLDLGYLDNSEYDFVGFEEHLRDNGLRGYVEFKSYTDITLTLSHNIEQKLNLKLELNGKYFSYENYQESGEDHFFGFTPSITWNINRIISLGLRYKMRYFPSRQYFDDGSMDLKYIQAELINLNFDFQNIKIHLGFTFPLVFTSIKVSYLIFDCFGISLSGYLVPMIPYYGEQLVEMSFYFSYKGLVIEPFRQGTKFGVRGAIRI